MDVAEWNTRARGKLPGYLGIEIVVMEAGKASVRMDVAEHHLAPNGFLHGGSVIALADTAAGVGCLASLPDGALSFTTVELKSNFLSTVTDGGVVCDATLVHGGRTTQVWDAEVRAESTGKVLALFRCTQLVLWPR
jgi:1,4-dihydroxy-2-naphthoyl-CoA hydrolase